jgi:hypothetical protein
VVGLVKGLVAIRLPVLKPCIENESKLKLKCLGSSCCLLQSWVSLMWCQKSVFMYSSFIFE